LERSFSAFNQLAGLKLFEKTPPIVWALTDLGDVGRFIGCFVSEVT
jgi:hypothetical protein